MNTLTQQKILEEKATLARERLLAVVDELDRKRHALSHPVKLVKSQLPEPVWMVAGGVAAVTAVAAIAELVVKIRAKNRPLFRVERRRPQPRFFEDVGIRTGKALLTFALVQLGKALLQRGAREFARPPRDF